jgi:DNA repair protein RadC
VPSLIAQSSHTHQTIASPTDAARYLTGEMSLLDQEELWVLNLSTRNTVLGTSKVYRGSVNTSLIRGAEIFRDAIRLNAPAIILAHNHPSSDPSPSQDDVTTTRSLIVAGRLLDIELVDHLIIGGQNFVSLKERGLAFEG